MDEMYYLQQIKNCQAIIENNCDEIRRKEEKLEELKQFSIMVREKINDLESDLYYRRQKLKNATIDPNKVRFYKKYQEIMGEVLCSGEITQIMERKEETLNACHSGISRLEDELNMLRSNTVATENRIENYRYQLRKERSNENVSSKR